MNNKLNSEMSAGTTADKSGVDEVTTSSHSSENTNVGGSTLSKDRLYYVKNCFWHIEQYFKGNGSKKEAMEAIISLQNHIEQFKK